MSNYFSDIAELMSKHNQQKVLLFVEPSFYDELLDLKKQMNESSFGYSLYSSGGSDSVANKFLSKNKYFNVNQLGKSITIFNVKDFSNSLKELTNGTNNNL